MTGVSLKIGTSLTSGLGRVANRNGLLIMLSYMIVGLVWQVLFYSAVVAQIQSAGVDASAIGLPSIDAPFAVLAVGALLLLLVLQYLTIIAIRTFVGGYSSTIPSEAYTRNIGLTLVNSILAGISFGVLVMVGSVFLFIPGIIAYVAFIFGLFYVAAEDENFIAGLRNSWSLTRGNWLRLFVLLMIAIGTIALVSGILSFVASLVVSVVGGQAAATLASGVISLPFSVLTLGVLAEAFNQLQGGEAAKQGTPTMS